MRELLVSIAVLLGVSFACAQPEALQKGQIWTFQDAPSDNARIIIGDVEELWGGKEIAVSISIVGLDRVQLPSGHISPDQIYHLPFAYADLKTFLLESTSEKIETPAGYLEGYEMWKTAVSNEEAGVFTIPPAEVIGIVLNTIPGDQ